MNRNRIVKRIAFPIIIWLLLGSLFVGMVGIGMVKKASAMTLWWKEDHFQTGYNSIDQYMWIEQKAPNRL